MWPSTNVRVNTWMQRQSAAITRLPCSWPPYTESWTRLLLYIRVASVHSPVCTRAHTGANTAGDLTETVYRAGNDFSRVFDFPELTHSICNVSADKELMLQSKWFALRKELFIFRPKTATAVVPMMIPRKGHKVITQCHTKLLPSNWTKIAYRQKQEPLTVLLTA